VDVVHVVGGGARNALLCQLTADACGLPVLAGPVEAAALGNVLVQARAGGVLDGGLPELRALLSATQDVVRYAPTPGVEGAWAAAEDRLG
jgi:rhamnulokinase